MKCPKCKKGYIFIRPYGTMWLEVCSDCRYIKARQDKRTTNKEIDFQERRTKLGKFHSLFLSLGNIFRR